MPILLTARGLTHAFSQRPLFDGISFTIENSGIIPSSQLPFLFNRLYRSDQSRNTPGSGLGLAIVDELVRAYDGKMRFYRSDLGGFGVNLTLPMGPSAAAKTA